MTSFSRAVAVEIVIAVAICGMLYLFLIEPMQRRGLALRSQLDAMVAEAGEISALTDELPKLTGAVRAAERDAERFSSQGRLARDEEIMFDSMMGLAKQTGAVIEQIAPLSVTATNGWDERDLRRRYAVSGTASYASLVRMMNDLSGEDALARVGALRVTPSFGSESEEVSFQLTLDVFAFDATPIESEPSS